MRVTEDDLLEEISDLRDKLQKAIEFIEDSKDSYHLHADFCKWLSSPTFEDCDCGADKWSRERDKFIKENKAQ